MFIHEVAKMPEDECMHVYMRPEESEVHVDVKHESSKGTECRSEISQSDRSACGRMVGCHVSRVTTMK